MLLQCIPPKVGVVGAAGFDQPRYGYHVTYRDPAAKEFLGPGWKLDNYYVDKQWNKLEPKKGPDYIAIRELDEDDDGVISPTEKNEEPIYDLRFLNAEDDGVIWIKAHPVARADSRRDLEVVLNNYADGLAGTGLYAQSNLFNVQRTKQRQFTTFLTTKEPIQIGPLKGLAGTIELAEVEKLRLDPQFRSERIKVVFIRCSYFVPVFQLGVAPVSSTSSSVDGARVVKHNGEDCYKRPALLIAGYANTVSRFDSHLKDFDQALSQLVFSPESAPDGAEGKKPAALGQDAGQDAGKP